MNAQDIASSRASKPSNKKKGSMNKMSENSNMTTLDDLLSSYQTETITLSSGRIFEIQSISPGEFAVSSGSPLVQKLVASGINLEDDDYEEKAQEYMTASITDEEWLDIILSEEHKTQIARVLTSGIISIKFLARRQSDCPEGYASIDNLTLQEQSELFVAILNLSVSEEDSDSFRVVDGKPE